jgi:hypothetical protein
MLSRRTLLTAAAALPFAPVAALAADAGAILKVRDFYNRTRGFSETAERLHGERIVVEGFMAPPLKADSRFFVLTKMPMSVCPFCETAAEWPDDIMAVYTKRVVDVIPFNVKIETRGVLELGEFRDPDTGFVSLVRLADATYAR